MNKYSYFLINIILIALPLALLEIRLEKAGGWGSNWPKDRWYSRPFMPKSILMKLFSRIFDIHNPLNYHILIFAILLPSICLIQYFYLTKNIILLISCLSGILLFEDFFWFLCNWHFDSMQQLLKGPTGTIWWHKRWYKITNHHYLPAIYFPSLAFSLFFLLLA